MIELVASGSSRFKYWIASIVHVFQLRVDAERQKLQAETEELEARAQLARAKAYRELGDAVRTLRESGYEVMLVSKDGGVPHISIRRGDSICEAEQLILSESGDDEMRASNDQFVRELAKVVWDRDIAASLLLGIGFPREHMPCDGTSYWFWTRVVEELRNGMSPGIQALVERAATLYPGNSVFRGVARRG